MPSADYMNDEGLADQIVLRKQYINEETGKPYGLRLIAEQLGISYGKARWLDEKYNGQVSDKYHPEVEVEAYTEFNPLVSYVWDLETTNLNTFMGQLLVASFLDLSTGKIQTRTIFDFGGSNAEREKLLLFWTIDRLTEADILIGHNTLGFDMGFLRGRLAIHGLNDVVLPKRQHLDTYQIARHGFKGKPQGYSLENLADFFRLPVGKDKPSKHDWAASIILDEGAIGRIAERCEADCVVNAHLWTALRPYWHSWKGR